MERMAEDLLAYMRRPEFHVGGAPTPEGLRRVKLVDILKRRQRFKGHDSSHFF